MWTEDREDVVHYGAFLVLTKLLAISEDESQSFCHSIAVKMAKQGEHRLGLGGASPMEINE